MTEISRRTFTRAAAWSVPVIAAAVAVPLAAASTQQRAVVVLTNKTAGVGGKPNTIFINYKGKHTEGPDATGLVAILVTATRDGVEVYRDERTWVLAGWGVTEYVSLEIPGIAKGAPVTVTVLVTHEGAYQDGFSKTIETPGWWARA